MKRILIVGVEYDEAGNAAPPGRVQQPLSRIVPSVRELLAGQKPGMVVPTSEGRTFSLTAAYIENPNPPKVETQETDIEAEVAGTSQG